ncbi:MAG TPA: TonB-dependent receptor [Gemmatimonadota bacterium]|nr:TonB-dependent receptor [Gemmatimonadota bacterium]
MRFNVLYRDFYRHLYRLTILSALVLTLAPLLAADARAQERGSIAGRVLSADGAAAADATVTIVNGRRRAPAGPDGSYHFANVLPGDYLLEARSPRYGIATARVRVTDGEAVEQDLALDFLFHAEPITVTTAPGARGLDEVAQPVQVLGGRELAAQREATLGQTLADEPGVSSTYFGPGASRPVIRGLGGDRIRILEAGIGSGDASSTSPDHAISHDPLSTERIEIVRGPATLLYGSSAIGGVVNVIDNRIPRYGLEAPLTGLVELRGGTVADERSGALSLSGGLGPAAWHLGGVARDTDDYQIPGFAESDHEEDGHDDEEEPFGVLPNSALETRNLTGGLSLVGDAGFVGIAASRYENLYGIPGHGHGEEHAEGEDVEEEHAGEEEGVRIDMEQRRFDLEGELDRPFGALRGLRVRLGTTDYEHVELEGDEVGTRFSNESWEGRIEAPHRPWGRLSGALGLQLASRDFEAVGEEAFVPPTETDTWAVFVFEELDIGAVRFQFGGRYENGDITAAEGPVRERSLDAFSASGGLVWHLVEAYAVSLSVARTTRIPTAEELFSNGPHIATSAFEIGDPDLGTEKSLGLDLGVRRTAGRVAGEINLFANRFSDFIFEAFTGEEEDGLRILRYTQADALFTGAEAHFDIELFHVEPHHVGLELSGDFVRAELTAGDEPLPRIPPARLGAGLHYQGDPLWGSFEVRRAMEQDRVAPLETPTEGYTTVDATLGYRFFAGGLVHDLILRGANLTDAEARNHVSFLKELAPLPGRDISLAYRLSF